ISPAGVLATACRQRGPYATREVPAVIAFGSTGNSRETGRADWDDGEARSTAEAGELRRREGASVGRKRNKQRRTGRLAMSLTTPTSVQKLQTALHDKAKGSPNFRFLCSVRQGASTRRSGFRLRMLQSQWRSSGSGWPNV